MIKKNMQHKIFLGTGNEPTIPFTFEIGKKVFSFVEDSNRKHLIPDKVPIGVIYGGSVGQFIAVDQFGKRYEVYVYCYKKLEGLWCTVVDAMEGDEI